MATIESRIKQLEQRLGTDDVTGLPLERLSDDQLASIVVGHRAKAADLSDEELLRVIQGGDISSCGGN